MFGLQPLARRRLMQLAWPLAAVAALITAVLWLTGSVDSPMPSVAAAVVAVTAFSLLSAGTYRLDWVLESAGALIVVAQLAGVGAMTPSGAAFLLFVLGAPLMAVLPSARVWPVWAFGAAIVVLPFFGEESHRSQGLALGLAFGLGAWLQTWVIEDLHEAVRGRTRFYQVLDRLPVPLFHEDFSEVCEEIERLRSHGVADLAAHLASEPGELARLVGMVRVIDVNEAAVVRFGLGRIDTLGHLRPSIVNPENRDSFLAQILTVAERRTQLAAEYSSFGERQSHYRVEWLASEPDFSSVMVAIHDITDLRAESNLQRALVEARDRFIATISHELRTPLTAVLGFATELESVATTLDRSTVAEYAGMIAEQGREVAYLVEDLLVAERSSIDRVALAPTSVGVAALCARVLADAGVAAQLDCSPEVRAYADELRVRQILRNLVTNAVRYGGPDLRIGGYAAGGSVTIVVSDDGPGVAVSGDLFDAYVTGWVSRPTGSTGLGLFVSRSLARAMGGDVVYVRTDRTEFRLTLPAKASEEEHIPGRPSEEPAADPRIGLTRQHPDR